MSGQPTMAEFVATVMAERVLDPTFVLTPESYSLAAINAIEEYLILFGDPDAAP